MGNGETMRHQTLGERLYEHYAKIHGDEDPHGIKHYFWGRIARDVRLTTGERPAIMRWIRKNVEGMPHAGHMRAAAISAFEESINEVSGD
jgi:hypothetical protein